MPKSIIQSALLVMIATLLGRAMGFIRTIFVSQAFGTSLEASAYMLAFTIPNTLFTFLPGVMNAVFIPVLKGLYSSGNPLRARLLFQKMLTITTLIYLLLGVFIWIWADPITSFIASGGSEALKDLSAHLLRLMTPSLLFIVLLGLFSSTLNVHYYFVLPTLGTIMNSLIVILSLFFLVPSMGINGLAIGTTLGFAGGSLMMLPFILKEKYSLRPDWRWRDEDLITIGWRFIPILLGSFLTTMNEFIEKFLVAGFGDDKIAALGYARQLVQLPIAILFGAIVSPLYILLLDQMKGGKMEETRQTLSRSVTLMTLLFLPITVGIGILAAPLVSLLFERGAFDARSTEITSIALLLLGISLLPTIVKDLFTRVFYALDNTWIPVVLNVLQILFYILLSLLLIPRMGFGAVALGWSLASLLGALLIGALLWKKIGPFLGRSYLRSLMKGVAATFMTGLMVYGIESLLIRIGASSFLHLVAGGGSGLLLYLFFLFVLKEENFLTYANRLLRRRRVRRKI
ncbi:putative MviN-like protein [[Clostridium] ultunense Esp]|nr:putative MviN-like protein [[Clostridium] ultunense Esp]